jgi:type IV pilus assembly protein PilA
MVKQSKSYGFALVETGFSLIAVASMFLSIQQQELNKQQVMNAIAYSQSSQKAVVNYYNKNGVFPTNNNQAHIPSADKLKNSNISKMNINEFGEITITFTDNKQFTQLSNKTIVLEPKAANGKITWTCDQSSVDYEYLPASCINFDNNKYDKIMDFLDNNNLI